MILENKSWILSIAHFRSGDSTWTWSTFANSKRTCVGKNMHFILTSRTHLCKSNNPCKWLMPLSTACLVVCFKSSLYRNHHAIIQLILKWSWRRFNLDHIATPACFSPQILWHSLKLSIFFDHSNPQYEKRAFLGLSCGCFCLRCVS